MTSYEFSFLFLIFAFLYATKNVTGDFHAALSEQLNVNYNSTEHCLAKAVFFYDTNFMFSVYFFNLKIYLNMQIFLKNLFLCFLRHGMENITPFLKLNI